MKRIAASVGLLALGASGLQAADTANLSSMQGSKPWSVSATLRGFYDDNINTAPKGVNRQEAFGYEVNPSVSVGIAGEQTSASLGYTYSGKYYDHRPAGSKDKWDHTHIFDAGLSHEFSPRFRLGVRDSFVIGQEPDVLRAGNTFSTFQRISGNNMRNIGSIVFNAEVTPLLGLEVGYANNWFNYDNRGATPDGAGFILPSRSGVLDRMEHAVHIDSRWHFLPQTTGIFGYQYSQTDYIGNEDIQGFAPGFAPPGSPPNLKSKNRNSRSHYLYAGVEQSFTSDLSGSVRIGGQHIDFYNDPTGMSEWSPYAQASLKYLYAVESSVEVGLVHQRSASDIVGPVASGAATGNFIHDTEATTAYGAIRHRIMPKLYGSLMGTFQDSTFNGGGVLFDNKSDRFYLVGLNLEYRFNQHFSAQTGYNYDRLESDIAGRSFTRNRIYVGVTAAY
jgi:hypothetical protein